MGTIMTDSNGVHRVLELDKIYQGIGISFGNEAMQRTRELFEEYWLDNRRKVPTPALVSASPPSLTPPTFSPVVDQYLRVDRSTAGDGEIVIPYHVEQNGSRFDGDIHFTERGSIYDGMHDLRDRVPPGVTRFLIVAAFGPQELQTPLGGSDALLVQGAKSIYEEDMREEVGILEKETSELVELAQKFLEIAEKEERWFNSWNPDEISDIMVRRLAKMNTYPTGTIEGAEARLKAAESMIESVVRTYSGAMACVQTHECEEREIAPACSPDEEIKVHFEIIYYRDGSALGEEVYTKQEGQCKRKESLLEEMREKNGDFCDRHPNFSSCQ